MLKTLLFTCTLLCAFATQAETLPDFDADEPAVTIRHDNDRTYYEYHVNGQLREIKVVPKGGRPYYLVPAERGDGFIRAEESQLLIPKWILFRW